MGTQTREIAQVEASSINPVSASVAAAFSINLYEYQGRAHISWTENFQGMVRLAVAIYSGTQPSNPEAWLKAIEVTKTSSGGSWDSGQPWGSGFSAALLGVNAGNNDWVYIGCNTAVTR